MPFCEGTRNRVGFYFQRVFISEMQAKADAQLLREYARQGSEAAFGELVARYTDLVYSTVLRQAGSADVAEEVAQSVFTDLARKAPELAGKLGENGSIVGWLYRSSRFALSKYLRGEHRRQNRESQAMQNLDPASSASPDWEHVRPVLDNAMADLSEEDRQAMLLRFFQNQGFEAVGLALGISDDAAQKRVGRALDKLRAHLARKGITTTAALLSAVLTTHAVQTAPAGLAAKLAGASLAGAAAKTGTTLTIMTLTTFKTGIVVTTIAALALGLVAERRSLNQSQNENAALRQQISQLGQPTRQPVSLKENSDELETLRREHSELLRLRGEVGVLRDTKEKLKLELASTHSENDKLVGFFKAEGKSVVTVNALKIIGSACYLYAKSNDNVFPTSFAQIQKELDLQGPGFSGGIEHGVGTNSFEFVDYGTPMTMVTNSRGKLAVPVPYLILAREKQARQMPDGTWWRDYLFFDGSVQQAQSKDGNFDTWEKEWMEEEAQREAKKSEPPSGQ